MRNHIHLEWWHRGEWKRIGWVGTDAESDADLREHGMRLAAAGGYYRLTTPSVYADAPPTVIYEYPAVIAESV